MIKSLYITLLMLIYVSIYGEIYTIPEYNYSINPLEGWVLQPYENSSDLSWFSADNSIALFVTAWDGDKFSNLKSMFNEISSGLDAYGDFVPLDYLGLESAIGEITFNIGNKEHKGWSLIINGINNDYYISSFSLLESYNASINEIQSVIDSFFIGAEGALKPGPISTFLNASPNRILENFTVDFLSAKLTVPASEYDFGSSQAIIEREAKIMENYSNDPNNFYNAWKRYYQVIFKDNYTRLEPLFLSLKPYFADNKYTDYELVELLMFWIQTFTYERSLNSSSDLLNPLEGALKKIGDCDGRSLILGILLHKFGIKSLLLTSEKVKHALIAADIPGEGSSYNYQDKQYLMIELTTKALIGEIKETMINPKLWTPVEMEYSYGY